MRPFKISKVLGWTLLGLGVGLGVLATRDGLAQTSPAAAAVTPAPITAPAATLSRSTAQNGSGQGSSATAPAAAQKDSGLTPAFFRISDKAINGDIAYLRAQQERLQRLNDAGDSPFTAYQYAKALHWVDFALDEYQMKNYSGVIEEALAEGVRLIEALEKKQALGIDTPILPSSQKVRADLWANAEKLKADAEGFKCSAADVARTEVQLVWAGHIQRQLGWRSAKPHLEAAERYSRDALAGAAICPRPVRLAAAPGGAALPAGTTPAAPKLDDAALAKLPVSQQMEILADRVHFAYNAASISVATAPVLDRVASLLRGNTAISLTVEGHADERGSDDYNLKLSRRRADAVRAYLAAAGVAPARLKTLALGKSKPEVKADGIEEHAQNRRVVFVPAAAAGFQINPQREDLQLKGDPAARKPAAGGANGK